MKIIEKWNSVSLIIRIVCGLIIGAILGILIPHATGIALLGELFVGALKAIAPILVLVLVASSLANAKGGHAHKFRTVILLYLLSTMSASALAVIVNFLFPTFIPVDGVTASDEFTAPSGMAEVIGNLLKNIVANPVDAVLNANYIGILFWAVILGLALKRSSDGTKRFLDDLADAISKIVRGHHQFRAVRHTGSGVQLCIHQRSGHLRYLRSSGRSACVHHASGGLCVKSADCRSYSAA